MHHVRRLLRRIDSRARRAPDQTRTVLGVLWRPSLASWRVCLSVCLTTLLCVGTTGRIAAAADDVIDRVLAVAGGEVITLSDVRAALALGRVQAGTAADPNRVALTQLIDRALLLAEVNRFAPPEPSALTIDSALDSVVARFPTAEAFDAALERLGVDRAFVRELLREDLRIRAYLDQRFTAQTLDEQRALVDVWIAGLRRRGDVVDQYDAPLSAPAPGTAGSGRD